jgi:hypothetical protein
MTEKYVSRKIAMNALGVSPMTLLKMELSNLILIIHTGLLIFIKNLNLKNVLKILILILILIYQIKTELNNWKIWLNLCLLK